MRLNLVPQTVKTGGTFKGAAVISTLIALAGIGLAVFMVLQSNKEKQAAVDAVAAIQPEYDKTVQAQKDIENFAAGPEVQGVVRNINLTQSMIKHIDEYPKLYSAIMPYIPSFFRVTHMEAAAGADGTVVTMTGTISSFQEYADLMLALLRIPQPYGPVTSISRAGFQHNDLVVPAITELDQRGRIRKLGESPLPDDPLQRLEAQINAAGATQQNNYLALNGFGSDQPTTVRGAMPNESLITVRLVLPYKMQAPNPRATLALFAGSGEAPGGGQAPAGGGGGAPQTPPAGGGAGAPQGKGGGGQRGPDAE